MSESTNPTTPDDDIEIDASPSSRTVPYVVAKIRQDAVAIIPTVVPTHEVLVLVAVHGAHRVEIDETADLPTGLNEFTFEPEDEFARLVQRYGYPQDSAQSYAERVFDDADGLIDKLDRIEAGGAPRAVAKKTAAKKTAAKKAS
jgi:hypothetical protein